MQQKLALTVQEALLGSNQVTITFKKDAPDRTVIRGIFYLLGMVEVRWISLSKDDQRIMRVFLRDRKWEQAGSYHSILITFTSKFNKSWFVDKIHPAVEHIEVVANNKIEVIVSDELDVTFDKQIESTNN